ncbi:unnamed protein product [Sphagnum jensenii]|uniref:Uncharacterized protein n=1 Tax=Sphagnum jensenii TaxID=128206 RepID=A0ABP1BH26_9BRYO
MAGSVVNETIDTYHDAVSEDQSQEGDVSNPLTRGAKSSSPASEPQAAGSAGGSNADMEGGNGPVDDGKCPQQHPSKPIPPPENGLSSSHSSQDAVEGWHPGKSLQVQRVVQLTAELEAKEEENKNLRAREKEMKLQLNQLQMEKEKLLDQILHLEHQHAAKSLQGGSYLDDSKAATPALLVTAINTVRDIGKKFTKDFMDQLKKNPEKQTFDELTESQLFGNLQHRDCILTEKKHPNTPFYESFCKLAVSVWLVHRLAFAFKIPATTFVVEKGLPFDHHRMQSAGPPDDITPNSKVGLVVLPGFQVSQSTIACEVYLVEHA